MNLVIPFPSKHCLKHESGLGRSDSCVQETKTPEAVLEMGNVRNVLIAIIGELTNIHQDLSEGRSDGFTSAPNIIAVQRQ